MEFRRLMTFPSVAKQLVDAGLGTRPGVDALDDHGAGETGTGAIFGRKRAGDDDRISGDTAHEDFAALPVDDLGGRAEEDAHGKDGAFLNHHAFGNFGAGADEAIVLNDDGAGLERFQHAADAGAARDMNVLPIWAQLPMVAQVSTIVPSPT